MADFSITGEVRLNSDPAEKSVSKWTVAAGQLIANFATAAASQLTGLVKSAVSTGAAFETSLAKVGTIADSSKLSTKELSDQITAMSGQMGVAASDIAEAAYQAISAGQDTSNAVAFAGKAAKLAAAGFTSSSSAVDILTTALNAYGMSAEQADHVSDVLLTTQNLGKTSVDELSASMGKVIPLAAAYGVSVENLSSGLAVMTANGIATAEATTYTKSMLNELGDSGSTVGKILQQQTGKSFAQLNAEGKSLGDVLQILYDSVGNDGTAFAGLWSSVEAGTGALSLVSGGADKFNGVLAQMQNSAGATEAAYETMTDTLQHKVETIQTLAENLGISLYDSMESSLSDVAQWGVDCLTELSDALAEGGPKAMLAAAENILADLTQGVINSIPELITGATEVITSFVDYLADHADDIMDAGVQFCENIVIGITENLPSLITSAANLIARFAAALISHLPDILKCGAAMLTTLVDGIIRSIENLGEAALACIAKLFGVWDGSMDDWGHIGENIVSAIISGIAGMWNSLVSFVQQKIAALTGGAVTAVDNGIQNTVQSKANTTTDKDRQSRLNKHNERVAQSQASASSGSTSDTANAASAASAAATAAKKAASSTKKASAEIVKSISDTTTELKDGVTRTTETVTETLSNGTTQQKQTITSTSRQMVDGVLKDVKTVETIAADGKRTVSQTMETVRDLVSTVRDTSTALVDGIKTTTETVTKTLADGTETTETVITQTQDKVIDGALRTVETVRTIAADGTEQVAETVKDSAAKTLDGLWSEIKDRASEGILGTVDTLWSAVKSGDWAGIGKWVASTLYSGLTADQKEQLKTYALSLVDTLNGVLGDASQNLAQVAWSLGQSIFDGITGKFGDIMTLASKMGGTLKSTFSALAAPLSAAAKAISTGLSGGLLSMFPAIYAGFAGMIGTIGAAVEGMLAAVSAALSATLFGIPAGLVVAAAAVALGVAIAAIVSKLGGSHSSSASSSGGSSGSSGGPGLTGGDMPSITDDSNKLTDAIDSNTAKLTEINKSLTKLVKSANALVLSDNMAVSSRVAASGTAQLAAAANSYTRQGDTNITQNIYSKAQTAADQQREARWEADKARAQRR